MKRSPIFLVMTVAALGFGGLAYYVTSTPNAALVKPEVRRAAVFQPDLKQGAVKSKPELKVPKVTGEKVDLSDEALSVANLQDAVDQLVKASVRANGADAGAVLKTQVVNGTVVISLRRSMAGNFGSMQEATLIKSWQVSLGQLKEVKFIQIEVDGQKLDTLGHFEIDQPLSVIRDGSPEDLPRP